MFNIIIKYQFFNIKIFKFEPKFQFQLNIGYNFIHLVVVIWQL